LEVLLALEDQLAVVVKSALFTYTDVTAVFLGPILVQVPDAA